MAAARKRDQADLVARIDGFARNDHLILHTLQDGDQRLCRLEELVIAFTKVSLFHLHFDLLTDFWSPLAAPSQKG